MKAFLKLDGCYYVGKTSMDKVERIVTLWFNLNEVVEFRGLVETFRAKVVSEAGMLTLKEVGQRQRAIRLTETQYPFIFPIGEEAAMVGWAQ